MTVHLFGNEPSPVIATFGLWKTADYGEEKYGKATRDFIDRNFYVDNGLTSCPTESETIKLDRNTQAMLASAKLKWSRTQWTSWRHYLRRIVQRASAI